MYLKIKRSNFFRLALAICGMLCVLLWITEEGSIPMAMAETSEDSLDETMLMFVGEELSVVTVASRRPESPAAAPAIVRVVNRSTIEKQGFQTLAELLTTEPGFYMAPKARGTVPFLRGIPDGILILYDGVPLSMDLVKSLHPLDYELSLNNVKQVEIIRGPGSVLWGADAFAGIVNIVPLTGRDQKGLFAKVSAGQDSPRGVYMSYGYTGRRWDGYISCYGAQIESHDNRYLLYQRPEANGPWIGHEAHLDDSSYLELVGNARVGDWLSLSGRLSGFEREYTLHQNEYDDPEDLLSWRGAQKAPVSFIKASLTKIIGASHYGFTGYYQKIPYELTDAVYKRTQDNHLYYGELLWDRRMFTKGLLTVGASFRSNQVEDAVMEDFFYPGFLTSDFDIPTIEQENYGNDLKSIYSQYRHKFLGMDWWIGGRVDDHSEYPSKVSYNLGFNWVVKKDWIFKAVYGTAYRSPSAFLAFDETLDEMESISTANVQLAWTPRQNTQIAVTTFYSDLSDYIREDPYGGISEPANQEIMGVEFNTQAMLFDQLEGYFRLTALNSWGDQEHYSSLYTFYSPDGTQEVGSLDWKEPLDTGPSYMVRFGLTWRFLPKASLAINGEINDAVTYHYIRNTVSGRNPKTKLYNATLNFKDLFMKGSGLRISAKNIFDHAYEIPGFYGPVKGAPFSILAEISYSF